MPLRPYPDLLAGRAAFRLPLTFDPLTLTREVERLDPRRWTFKGYGARGVYGHYLAWEQFELRGGARINGRAAQGNIVTEGPFRDYGPLKRAPALRRAARLLGGSPTAINLLKLRCGGAITRHVDPIPYCRGRAVVPFHFAVTTNPGVRFFIQGRPLQMRTGEIWSINSTLPHEVYNMGRTDRVHMIVHLVYDAHVAALLEEAATLDCRGRSPGSPQARHAAKAWLTRFGAVPINEGDAKRSALDRQRLAAVGAQLLRMSL